MSDLANAAISARELPMSECGDQTLCAWETAPQTDMPIRPADGDRDWMDQTPQRFAYRCLPLVLANQSGWTIPAPVRFTARWNGGDRPQDVRFWFGRTGPHSRVLNHFGSGVLTFSLPYLFRTPRGINLWVKGPTNQLKDGIQPLEGLVETDWAEASFTMNWRFTRPNHSVTFEEGEPVCMIVPVPRGLAESLQPLRRPLADDAELEERYRSWSESRVAFMQGLLDGDEQTVQQGWQRDYMRGRTPEGVAFPEHQMNLGLREFHAPESPHGPV